MGGEKVSVFGIQYFSELNAGIHAQKGVVWSSGGAVVVVTSLSLLPWQFASLHLTPSCGIFPGASTSTLPVQYRLRVGFRRRKQEDKGKVL